MRQTTDRSCVDRSRKRGVCLLIATYLAMTPGCGTLMNKKSVVVNIDSRPRNAQVYQDGLRIGPTPQTVEISNQQGAQFSVRWSDGQAVECTFPADVNPLYVVGNVFFLVAGFVTDAITGGWNSVGNTTCTAQRPGAQS